MPGQVVPDGVPSDEQVIPGVDEIGANNRETLRRLGHEGWRRLFTE